MSEDLLPRPLLSRLPSPEATGSPTPLLTGMVSEDVLGAWPFSKGFFASPLSQLQDGRRPPERTCSTPPPRHLLCPRGPLTPLSLQGGGLGQSRLIHLPTLAGRLSLGVCSGGTSE